VLGIGLLPAGKPGGEVLLGFRHIPAVIEPPKLLQTVVVGFAGQVVEGVAEEMHVATLPSGFGERLHETLP